MWSTSAEAATDGCSCTLLLRLLDWAILATRANFSTMAFSQAGLSDTSNTAVRPFSSEPVQVKAHVTQDSMSNGTSCHDASM